MLGPARPVTTGRAATPAIRTITCHALVAVPSPPRISPYERGIRMGEQFITQRAGWTADQIITAYLYITGPFRDKTRHTGAEHDWFRGYTEPVTRHLAQIRAAQPGCGPGSKDDYDLQTAGGVR